MLFLFQENKSYGVKTICIHPLMSRYCTSLRRVWHNDVCLPVFCLLYSFFISSLERVKKQLKSLAVAAGHPTWRVINLLWLLFGPTKLLSAHRRRMGTGPSPSIQNDLPLNRCDTDDPADRYVWWHVLFWDCTVMWHVPFKKVLFNDVLVSDYVLIWDVVFKRRE